MKFKFNPSLDHQLKAVNSAIQIFKGQEYIKKEDFVTEFGIIGNNLSLNNVQILENLKQIKKENNIEQIENLELKDFSVEMETGTGKTYVYMRTIFELNKKLGFTKFIIIVPSIAIKEGVIKTIIQTKEHFKEIYDNVSYNYYEYNSKNLNQVRQFSQNRNIEIMIMTLDSFNKKDINKVYDELDKLQGKKPIDLIKKTNPILILDEPQNMESEKSKQAIKELNPLFSLRYSATHKEYYNLIYRLTPIEAYDMGLVKKIEVLSVVDENVNDYHIKVDEIKSDKKGIKVKLEVNVKLSNREYKMKKITCKDGDDLFKKTNNQDYKDLKIIEIDFRDGFIRLSNQKKIKSGEDTGKNKKIIFREQIKQTIREHIKKQKELKETNVKVISLFFIDKVDNYQDEEGVIRKIFEEEFNIIKQDKEEYKDLDAKDVHNGYFSQKKRNMENDKEVFDLIMKDKERLLSFDEKTQFIFSHSALREGWDNPNVFNICTLNETQSNLKKRQEIGRGLRLPLNQDGERLESLKPLTVIANESYKSYVERLQTEYIDELGNVLSVPVKNARKRKVIKLKKGFQLDENFKEIWEKINKKTKYRIEIDEQKFINKSVELINKISKVEKTKLSLSRVELEFKKGKLDGENISMKSHVDYNSGFRIKNILKEITEEVKINKKILIKILSQIENLNLIFENPKMYLKELMDTLEITLREFLKEGLKYVKIDEMWQQELFKEIETYEDNVLKVEDSIYEEIIFDSDGEKKFAQELDKRKYVKLFVKLPNWFKIKTPIGSYNPDWAVVRYDENKNEKLYLVRETKFVNNLKTDLRESEKFKIKCGEKHFKEIGLNGNFGDFKAIKSIEEL